MKCPCCNGELVSQPTTGTNYRQFICYNPYKTKEGYDSERMKCEYYRVERGGIVVFENIKKMYLTRDKKETR